MNGDGTYHQSACQSYSSIVTIKYRTGWGMRSCNAIKIGQIAQQYGASALVLHGKS